MNTQEPWVGVEQVANHLSVGKDTIYRWVDQQRIPSHRAGKLLRFKISEVDEWVRNQGDNTLKPKSDSVIEKE